MVRLFKKLFSTVFSFMMTFSIFWFLPFVYEFSLTKKLLCFIFLFFIVYYLVTYFLFDILIKIKDHVFAQKKKTRALYLIFFLLLSGVLYWGLTKLPTFRYVQGQYELTITAVITPEAKDNVRFLLKADSRKDIPINSDFSASYVKKNSAVAFKNPGDQFRSSFFYYKTSLELCFHSSHDQPYPLNVNLNGYEQVVDLGADGSAGQECYQIPVPMSFQSMYSYWKLIWIVRLLCLAPSSLMIVLLLIYLIHLLFKERGNIKLVDLFDSSITKAKQKIFEHKTLLLILLLFTLIAFGGTAFSVLLVGDDYAVLVKDQFQYSWVVQTGRWLVRYVWTIAADNTYANSFSIFFSVLGQTVSAFIIIKMLRLKRSFAKLIFCAVLIFHPIWVNAVLQRMTHFPLTVGVFLSCLFGYASFQAVESFLSKKNLKQGFGMGIIAIILFSLAASIYQVMVFYGVIAFLGGILVNFLDAQFEHPFKEIGLRLTIFLLIILIGLTLYFIQVDAFIIIYRVNKLGSQALYSLGGSFIKSIDELIGNLKFVQNFIHNFLFTPQYFMPITMKFIFLFFLAYLLYLPFTIKKKENARPLWKLSTIFLFVLLVGFILFTPWSLGVARNLAFSGRTFRPSALLPLAAMYAVFIGIVLDRVPKVSLRRIAFYSLSIILVVIFLFQHSAASFILHNLTHRDRAIANRILYMIESHPDYQYLQANPVAKMKVIGNSTVIEDRPFEELVNDPEFNRGKVICGMFNCQQDRLGELLYLLQYGTIKYQVRTITEFSQLTVIEQEIISEMVPYPDENSIKIFENGEIFLYFGLNNAP